MRKFLLTSACTLGLSLLGAFGLNQNSLDLNNLFNTNSNTTQVVKSITDLENNQSLPSDNQTTPANTAAEDINTDKSVLATIRERGSVCNDVTTATPTKAPVVTALPAPTKTPIVTSTPAATVTPTPTKTPEATVAPTKTPVATVAPAKTPVATATPTPTVKPATTTNSSSVSSYASEVLRLVNIERAKAGLSAYTTNQTITAAANKRAQETSVSFSHTRLDGSSFSSVLKEFGISYMAAGENIAYGQRTPQEVVTGWMNSPGHRANILNAKFHKIGIGVYKKKGLGVNQNREVIYWTQEFTN